MLLSFVTINFMTLFCIEHMDVRRVANDGEELFGVTSLSLNPVSWVGLRSL